MSYMQQPSLDREAPVKSYLLQREACRRGGAASEGLAAVLAHNPQVCVQREGKHGEVSSRGFQDAYRCTIKS